MVNGPLHDFGMRVSILVSAFLSGMVRADVPYALEPTLNNASLLPAACPLSPSLK